MRVVILALALALGGACRRPPTSVDAGQAIERGTDIRSVLIEVVPEIRGLSLVAGRAQVTRQVAPATAADLAKASAIAARNGFQGDPPARPPFVLEQKLDGDVLRQEIRLKLSPAELSEVLAAPTGISSEGIAHWIPKVSTKRNEEFQFEVMWVGKDTPRAEELVQQLTQELESKGWARSESREERDTSPDSENASWSEQTGLTHELGKQLEIKREHARTKLVYRLTTFERH